MEQFDIIAPLPFYMLELILLLIIAFCAGASTWGATEYFLFKRGEKEYSLYTLTTETNEFVGYEVIDGNKVVHKFIGEQRLVEPYMLEFVKGKTKLER